MSKSNLYFHDDDKKRKTVQALITYVEEQFDVELGNIASEQLLEFVLDEIGEDIYRKGVEDAKKVLETHNEDLLVELDILTPRNHG